MEAAQGPAQQEVHGNQNAISFSGDASVHIHPPPVPSVLPERVWMVSYRRNPFFTGRERLLSTLHERFTTDQAAVLTQGQAISGLGGIGKTQLAVEYAYRYQGDYRFVLWVNATTPTTLTTGLATLADRLQLPERLLPDQEKIVAAALHWLATHEGWLLIVDNADELERVWPWLPTGSTGHVLLTTREQAVRELERFPVEQMDHAEGTLLLLRRAGVLTSEMKLEQVSLADRQVAELIVTAMDGLPLALDQAGAFIEETQSGLSDYLKLYHTRQDELLQQRGRLVTDHPDPVATTWSLSFEKVRQANPAAADLLRLCAFLDADVIQEEIITKGASELGSVLQPVATDPIKLNEAIGALLAYSLVRRNLDHTLTVHRLVQAVLKHAMNKSTQRRWAERAVRAVNQAFPEVEYESWLVCQRYISHVLECAALIEQWDMAVESQKVVPIRFGQSLRKSYPFTVHAL